MARIVLFVAAVVEFLFRGLPALFANEAVAEFFRLEYIEGAVPYVHAFGAVMVCLGVLLFIGSRNPGKNRLIVDIGILRFALGIVAQSGTWVMMGSLPLFWKIHMGIDLLLVILLLVIRPQTSR